VILKTNRLYYIIIVIFFTLKDDMFAELLYYEYIVLGVHVRTRYVPVCDFTLEYIMNSLNKP